MERWRLFGLTTLLSVVFLAGLFAMGEAGRARLELAAEDMQDAMRRRILVGELRQHVAEAALASRSLLLTGRHEYVVPLRDAASDIAARAEAVMLSYVDGDPRVAYAARQMRYLAGVQTGAIMSLVALHTSRGAEAARELALAQVPAVDPIARFLVIAERLENYETAHIRETREHWRREQRFVQRLGLAGLLVNVLLVVSASLLALAAVRRHRDGMALVARRKDELELEAVRRAAELNEVYGHLQTVQEQERARLARGLHDELGGLLLAARMDAAWVRRHASEPNRLAAVVARIDRIVEALDDGIDLKRRVIEELRPTLLDNMGLLAALRWQVDETCGRAGIECACHFPAVEPDVSPHTAIALFRVLQEALTNVVKHASASRVDVTIDVTGDYVLLSVVDDGCGIRTDAAVGAPSHGLAGMKHRVVALGGTFTIGPAPTGGTEVRAMVPHVPVGNGKRDPRANDDASGGAPHAAVTDLSQSP